MSWIAFNADAPTLLKWAHFVCSDGWVVRWLSNQRFRDASPRRLIESDLISFTRSGSLLNRSKSAVYMR